MLSTWRFRFGVVFYFLISLCIILCASPIFRVVGFEYASLISLAVSIHLVFYVSEHILQKGNLIASLRTVAHPASVFIAIPFVLGVTNGLLTSQCDLLMGTLFYAEIVIPTAVISVLLGIHYSWMYERPLVRWIRVSVMWLATMVLSLLPGYINPQIFTYGWQYGFFPGFIWDPAIELNSAYWWSRLLALLFAIGFLIDDYQLIKAGAKTWKEKIKVRQTNFWQNGIFVSVPIFISLMLLSHLGITRSHRHIQQELSKTIDVKGSVVIHCNDSTFTYDELILLKYNCSLYSDSIRSFFGIKDNRLTHLYIYSSEEEMKKFVGTANASIAKPWMNELHVAKENLNSLKHELVHTLLAPYGSFPFDVSWSTGLTEGAAVAVEDDYYGIRSQDEYSARILQLGLVNGVKDIMSFAGFASESSGKSYTLAGSFSKYLITSYGSAKFLKLYGSRDYDIVYGKSIEALEREWITSLKPLQTPMNKYDSLRTRFYFDRTSIVNEPCLRRIGRMMKKGRELYDSSRFTESLQIFSEVIHENSDNLSAIRGKALSLIQINDPLSAIRTLSEANGTNTHALHNLKGDCYMLSGNLVDAREEWRHAMKIELSSGSVQSAYLRYHYLTTLENDEYISTLKYLYSPTLKSSEILSSITLPKPDSANPSARVGYDVLFYRLSRDAGLIKDAIRYAEDAIHTLRSGYICEDIIEENSSRVILQTLVQFVSDAILAMQDAPGHSQAVTR